MSLKISRKLNYFLRGLEIIAFILAAVFIARLYFWEQQYYRDKSASKRNLAETVITGVDIHANPGETRPADSEDALNLTITSSDTESRFRVNRSILNSADSLPVPSYYGEFTEIADYPTEQYGKLMTMLKKYGADPLAETKFAENDEIRYDGKKYRIQSIKHLENTQIFSSLHTAITKHANSDTLTIIIANFDSENQTYKSLEIITAK